MNPRIMKTLAGMALGLTIVATGTFAVGPAPAHAAAAAASTTAANVIATGQQYLGVPYQWGAKSGRTDRFDCSSFVQFSFAQNGINLPRSSRQQSAVGTFVPRDQLQPGDLVFFYNPIHHVAIYMGNGKILHTYGAPGVTVTDLNGSWSSRYTTARRVLPTGQAIPAAPAAPVYSAPVATAPAASAPETQTPAPVYSAPADTSAPSAPAKVSKSVKAKHPTHKISYRYGHSHQHEENQDGHQD